MNFKKRVNGSWIDTPHYIHNTSTDTLTTLPADLYADGNNATVGLKGNMYQASGVSPTTPIQPQECGERTGNLFNKNGEILIGNGSVINILATGVKTITETAGSNRYIPIKLDNELLGKTITISSTITQSANNKGQIRLFYVNGRYTTSSITAITTAGQTGYITRTYTMPSSIPSGSDGIAIVLSSDREGNGEVGDYVEYADLMIVEGSTAPSSYIPYGIKIPVSSGGTTTNVYMGEVESTRKIKKYEFTGQETVYEYDANNGIYRFRLSELSIERLSNTDIIVSHFSKAISTAEIQDGQYSIDTNYIYLRITSITSGSDFTTYLQQQYAAVTPVTVWYVLTTSTTGIVNEPIRKIGTYADSVSGISIPTIAGANTLSVDTTLQPSEVTVNYKGWHPVSAVHERESGAWD